MPKPKVEQVDLEAVKRVLVGEEKVAL